MIVFYQYFEEEFVRQEIDGELLVAEGVHASSSTAGSCPDLEGDGPKSLPHAHQKPDQPLVGGRLRQEFFLQISTPFEYSSNEPISCLSLSLSWDREELTRLSPSSHFVIGEVAPAAFAVLADDLEKEFTLSDSPKSELDLRHCTRDRS